MKIETKYNVGQTVFYMADNKVNSSAIAKIRVDVDVYNHVYKELNEILYILEDPKVKGEWYKESNLFETKKELLDSL